VNLTASGGNDTSAIQAAIDAAASGDTIDFAAGNYSVDGVTLKSGVTYHGEAGAVLHATGNSPVFSVDSSNSHDITIDSLHFVGTGADPTSGVVDLAGTGAAGSVDHITLSNSSFENNGLTFDFVKNSQIVNDQFSNIQGVGTGIHGYHMDSSTIGGNAFTNDYQAIGLIFGDVANQGHNVVVSDNVGTGLSRMGIEIMGSDPVYQGETTNLLVQGNSFTNWGTPSADGETTAYSIVTDGGTGTHVVGNYAQGGHASGYGIEMSGVGAVADGNYIDGFTTGIIGYSSHDVIQNNNIINYSSEATSTYTQTDEIVQNNTSDPSLAHPTSSGSGYAAASDPPPAQVAASMPDPAASATTDAAAGTHTASSPATSPVISSSGTSPSDGLVASGGATQAPAANGGTDAAATSGGSHVLGNHVPSGHVLGGASGPDAFVVPASADQAGATQAGVTQAAATTHAAAGTDHLDPTGTLGWTQHSGSGAIHAPVADSAYHGDGGAAAASGDGAATHADVTLQHLLPAAHTHGDYVWH
jgi:hypothetical protein